LADSFRRVEASAGQQEERVKPLELFFDLVFVFALTQVTSLLSADPTWGGLLRGMLVLGALWWAWGAYAWLTNTLNPEEGMVRIAMFAVMGAMLIVALAVPEAFDDHGVLFGVAYLIVRAMHLALYALAAKGDHDLLGAVLRMTPSSTISAVLIITAGFLEDDARIALWATALAIDYLGVLVGRGGGWRVSPGHFAERHGLIIIIAIGESIVAVGVGAAGVALGVGAVTASLLGVVVAAALWWTYFDWASIVTERMLSRATGAARASLARDVYSYLHLPMVAGIVLFAMAMKKTLANFDEPLQTVPAVALFGGLALYLLAHVLLRLRISGSMGSQLSLIQRVGRGRPLAMLALIALFPLGRENSALAALATVAAVFVALIAYEAIRYRESRAQIRAGEEPTQELMSRARAS
jgi:low temperature requirement protein LtrA